MPDIIADWLAGVAGCGITAADLPRMRHHPEFKAAFDALTSGNAEAILDAAAENAERSEGMVTAAPPVDQHETEEETVPVQTD